VEFGHNSLCNFVVDLLDGLLNRTLYDKGGVSSQKQAPNFRSYEATNLRISEFTNLRKLDPANSRTQVSKYQIKKNQ